MSTHNKVVNLNDDERALVVEKKATCPFIGAAIFEGHLKVRNDARNPLATIEDVKNLGDSGGGHLGDVLELFANGNHGFMRSDSGELNKPVPDGLFSLEFPGSQGSHAGHSGILQGDPKMLDSGRLDEESFSRLISRAQEGFIKRSDVGRFIANNVFRDEKSTVRSGDNASRPRTFFESTRNIASTVLGIFDKGVDHRDILQKLTKLAAEDNLVGSAGEFGLLFAFLANKPGAQKLDDEPALAVEDLKLMFLDKRLPAGWETWEKSAIDWVLNTKVLQESAREEYQRLQQTE
jgi:hypothetical protein